MEWAQAATKSYRRDVQLPAADDHGCSTSTKEQLCLIKASPVAKQVERHHFLLAYRWAIITFFSTFSILDPPGRLPTNIDLFLWHIDHHRRSIKPIQYTGACIHKAFPTSSSLHRCRPVLDPRRREAWQSSES